MWQRHQPLTSWNCSMELFRQQRENAGMTTLNLELMRMCLAEMKKFCSHIEAGGPCLCAVGTVPCLCVVVTLPDFCVVVAIPRFSAVVTVPWILCFCYSSMDFLILVERHPSVLLLQCPRSVLMVQCFSLCCCYKARNSFSLSFSPFFQYHAFLLLFQCHSSLLSLQCHGTSAIGTVQ